MVDYENKMKTRYFVKEPSTEVGDGTRRYSVVYEGENEKLATEIAEHLDVSVLSAYEYDGWGIIVSTTNYKDGASIGDITLRGMALINPLASLARNNAERSSLADRHSLSELLAEFTPKEIEFLREIDGKKRVA